MSDGVGYMADERTLLRANFAALNAEATIDAMLSVIVRAFKNGDGATCDDGNAQLCTTFDENIRDAS